MKTLLQGSMPNGDAYSVAGKHNGKVRQQIMLEITGVKLPIDRCGVNTIRAGLYEISGVTGNCIAVKDKNLADWIRTL